MFIHVPITYVRTDVHAHVHTHAHTNVCKGVDKRFVCGRIGVRITNMRTQVLLPAG